MPAASASAPGASSLVPPVEASPPGGAAAAPPVLTPEPVPEPVPAPPVPVAAVVVGADVVGADVVGADVVGATVVGGVLGDVVLDDEVVGGGPADDAGEPPDWLTAPPIPAPRSATTKPATTPIKTLGCPPIQTSRSNQIPWIVPVARQ